MCQKKSKEAPQLEHSGQGERLDVWSEVTWTLEQVLGGSERTE